ncbi:hypothetical protein K490DRAFT_73065 [Saccharata proteae CBS 121410]|uniref:BZIP domain-containing protein n=1 Tax=Saccharata proteae CBS 121410 TaxID=1314787 RepID=A0A9P4HYU3_9PEZI|nr:hypothetical protein K490DRAFT_73065 [Saccharata proteae CBS 121410]
MPQLQQHIDFHRPSSRLDHDHTPATRFFDDPDVVNNDSSILDPSAIMSPATSVQAIFSPDANIFEHDFHAPAFVERAAPSTNPFFQGNNNNPYMRLSSQPIATYGTQHPSWPLADEDDVRTPPSTLFGQDYETPSYVPVGSNEPFSLPLNVRPSSVFPPSANGNPPSPHSNQEWMAMAAQEMENRPHMSKRMRPNTPPGRSYSPFPRRDGIRKKNARFEIPAERSLVNIDQLIAQSNNEEEIKELKQQKRLLRNRQAALDSRQRKKKHTEELEEEKKLWTERVNALEDELQSMRLQHDAHMHEREQWHRQQIEAQQTIETLQWEKEEMVRTHTLETGELRKKVSVLVEKLETSSASMSAVPSSTFTEFAHDMDNLNMGSGNEWDNCLFNDYCMGDSDQQMQQPQPPQTETSLVHRRKDDQEKPVASGLLLMLLLCGAFVASKSSGGAPPAIPRMPDDVRAASATVLDSIFKDAGVQEHSAIANHVEALEPAPSGSAWPKPTLSGAEFASMSHNIGNSHLDQLHAHLTQPTKDQEAEQLFSITPSQYNSLTSADFSRRVYSIGSDDTISDAASPGSQPSHHRRNLAETLRAMREEAKGETAAEVYTRSLMWGRIPSDVVREFKRMVEETGAMGPSSPSETESVRTEVCV